MAQPAGHVFAVSSVWFVELYLFDSARSAVQTASETLSALLQCHKQQTSIADQHSTKSDVTSQEAEDVKESFSAASDGPTSPHRTQHSDFLWLLLKPKYVVSVYHILLAVRRALSNRSTGRMATRTLEKEILYWLSPMKDLSTSFKTFAVEEGSPEVTLLLLVRKGCYPSQVAEMLRKATRDCMPLSRLEEFRDGEFFRKRLDISPEEECLSGGLEAAMLTRIACKLIK